MCLVCSRREGAEWLKRSVRLKEWERIRAGKQWGPDNVEPQGLCKIFGFWVSEEPGPWTAKRSNQSTLKEISPEYSLEELMLKLKLQYFGHLMWRTDSLEKTLMLGKTEGRRRRGWQKMRWLDGNQPSSGSWWWTGKPGTLQSKVRHNGATELTWTELRSLEEGTATHSSVLAWRILWTEEPGWLQSTESQRVGHDWSNLAHMHASRGQ